MVVAEPVVGGEASTSDAVLYAFMGIFYFNSSWGKSGGNYYVYH